jgi:hypothetical protein
MEEAKEQVKKAAKGDLQALVTHLKIGWEEGLTPYNNGPLISDRWVGEHQKVTAEDVLSAL